MITKRRQFLLAGAALGIGGVAGRTLLAAEPAQPDEDVSAVEDLMREHGVLRRILLGYEECVRRLETKTKNDDVLSAGAFLLRSASLVQEFVEQYHEQLEEKFLFPEFEKHGPLVPLVKVLREQHAAGRALTKTILLLTDSPMFGKFSTTPESRRKAVDCSKAFIRMYGPHAAREDTVLFPAFKKILSAKQLDKLGDKFEEEENHRFGADGFGKMVETVAAIEKELGIYDLGQFTPKKTP